MPREAKSKMIEKQTRNTVRASSSPARGAKDAGQRATTSTIKQRSTKRKRGNPASGETGATGDEPIASATLASKERSKESPGRRSSSRNGGKAAAAPRRKTRRAPVSKAPASPSKRNASAAPRASARTGKRAKSVAKKRASTRSAKARPAAARKWSAAVTQSSDALDLQPGVFTQQSARAVATSLKRSAERSKRRKGTPYQSAVSMLNLYMNRSGANLSPARRRTLERAQDELKALFNRPA